VRCAGLTEDKNKMTEHFEDRVDGVEVQGHPSLTALVRILARAAARQQAREAAQGGGAEAPTDGLGGVCADPDANGAAAHARIEGDSAVSRDDDDET
jgi:hypothetical protein